MDEFFAERMHGVPRSFIREILKASLDPSVISFAGGLPNPDFFPVREIQRATEQVFEKYGPEVLQYSNSEGDILLREQICRRYREKQGLDVPAENIIITNGSQQGIDLLGKALLDEGDPVLIEEPGYLGTIQSLSLFRVKFQPVPVGNSGLDLESLSKQSAQGRTKMLYSVPTFQNPSGISYSDENKKEVATIAERKGFILVEDNPYGELRFSGETGKSFYHFLPERTVLLGSFSKVVAPGLRLGWIAAPSFIHEKLLIAKQAADLHTSGFVQKIVYEFLLENELDDHLAKITEAYGTQCKAMQEALARYLPTSIRYTNPEGGMFLWGQLPDTVSALDLFEEALEQKVVFVPGEPFYTRKMRTSTFRLNFSCVSPKRVEEGVKRLALGLGKFDKYL